MILLQLICSYVCINTRAPCVRLSVLSCSSKAARRKKWQIRKCCFWTGNFGKIIDFILQRVSFIVCQSTAALSHRKPRKPVRVAALSLQHKTICPLYSEDGALCAYFEKQALRAPKKRNFSTVRRKPNLGPLLVLVKTHRSGNLQGPLVHSSTTFCTSETNDSQKV
jgi:hypothetical protein